MIHTYFILIDENIVNNEFYSVHILKHNLVFSSIDRMVFVQRYIFNISPSDLDT